MEVSLDPFVLDLRGHTLDCSPGQAHVRGILTVTPESFSDGGMYQEADAAVERAVAMAREGAVLVDVGGASSRPRGLIYGDGAHLVSPEEEAARILPVIEGLRKAAPDLLISVDTFQESVARQALEAGAHLINDITALRHSPALADRVAEAGAGIALMHSRGEAGHMPHSGSYDDAVDEVAAALKEAAARARRAGVRSVMLDPGFGFGKTMEDNLRLIGNVDTLTALGYPVLIGVSRKSSIGAALSSRESPAPIPERLFGSLGATAVGVLRGASIVRTHDVAETVQMLRVLCMTAAR